MLLEYTGDVLVHFFYSIPSVTDRVVEPENLTVLVPAFFSDSGFGFGFNRCPLYGLLPVLRPSVLFMALCPLHGPLPL
jgi:hypothetical protein